jgi:CubicO group peptidase (beta-lactamase class C family)
MDCGLPPHATAGKGLCMKLVILLTILLLATSAVAVLLRSVQDATRAPATRMAAVLQPFVDRRALAGAVTLVADKDTVLSLEAVGFADLAANTAMRTDALFWIASLSKPMTAAALMMLVDEGQVKLDDPVETYLPEFKDQRLAVAREKAPMALKRPQRPVTVRHLLSHTSGMPFKSAQEEPTLDRLPLRDAVRSYASTPLQFEPGSHYQYSNAGFNTAGRIIEVVSGIPYAEFMAKRLFTPLGMTDTTFWPNDEQLARLAKSYQPNADQTDLEETTITQLTYPLNAPHRQPMPAGGLFSTAEDVGRFCRMMLNDGVFDGKRYLSPAAVAQMTRKQTGDLATTGYGLGWAIEGGTVSHAGAYATHMTIDAKRGLIMVFLVQHAGFLGNGGDSHAAFKQAAEQRFGGAVWRRGPTQAP